MIEVSSVEMVCIGTILFAIGIALVTFLIINLYRRLDRKRMLRQYELEMMDSDKEE
jgi:predicted MFS family arabinose efflux permease